MKSKIVIEMNMQQARNIQNGLELLQEKAKSNIAAVPPKSEGAADQIQYFREKEAEISQQIKHLSQILK